VSLILLAKALGATPGKTKQDLNLFRRILARLPLGGNRPVARGELTDDGNDTAEASARPQGAAPSAAPPPTVTAV